MQWPSVCLVTAPNCPTLCDPRNCSPPGSSAHGVFQARIPEWIVIPFSRGSSRPRDWTWVSCIAGRFFTIWGMREAPVLRPDFSHCNVSDLIEKNHISYLWKMYTLLFVKNVPIFSIIQRLLLLQLCRFYRGWRHHILTHRSMIWWTVESMDRFPLSHAKVLTDLVINILKSGYFLGKKVLLLLLGENHL